MKPDDPFEIPEPMRTCAETVLDQTRRAVDGLLDVTRSAMTAAESRATAAGAEALELERTVFEVAEDTLAVTFDHAHRLVRSETPQAMLRLQSDFFEAQAAAFGPRVRRIGEAVARVMASYGEPAEKH